MYTMISRSNQAQNAIAEIRMIQAAAQQYKFASVTNNYSGINWANNLGALAPYLGQSTLTSAISSFYGNTYRNIFRGDVIVSSIGWEGNKDLQLTYNNVPDIDICQKILNAFGEVESQAPRKKKDKRMNLVIKPGKTNSGFVGRTSAGESGCQHDSRSSFQYNVVALYLVID